MFAFSFSSFFTRIHSLKIVYVWKSDDTYSLSFFSLSSIARVASINRIGRKKKESWQMILMNTQHDMTSLSSTSAKEKKKKCHMFLRFIFLVKEFLRLYSDILSNQSSCYIEQLMQDVSNNSCYSFSDHTLVFLFD